MIHILRPDKGKGTATSHSKGMDSFDPLIQLKTLLGDKPNHPWGALIPQVLLWCFRRFCIEKLTVTSEVLLSEQLWDDHLDLIRQHAPKGLESVSASWFSPENIDHVHSSLEEYNRYFMEILVCIDYVVKESDAEKEDYIAEFLDVKIKDVIREWLSTEYAPFLIFPIDDKDDDEFTDEQFNRLLDSLMNFHADIQPVPPEPVEDAACISPVGLMPELTTYNQPPTHYIPLPHELPPFVVPNNEPSGPYKDQIDPMSLLSSPVPLQPEECIYVPPQQLYMQYPQTVRSSISHRKTRRRQAKPPCGKTRRIH